MIASQQLVLNEVYVFFNKNRYSDILINTINFINSVDKTFGVIKIMDFNMTGPRCYSAIFLTPVLTNEMELLLHGTTCTR